MRATDGGDNRWKKSPKKTREIMPFALAEDLPFDKFVVHLFSGNTARLIASHVLSWGYRENLTIFMTKRRLVLSKSAIMTFI